MKSVKNLTDNLTFIKCIKLIIIFIYLYKNLLTIF